MKLKVDYSNWLKWQPGRQGSGYEKMLVLTGLWPIPFDIYLVRYAVGQGIPPHTDPCPGYRHYRANLIVKKSKKGGEFKSQHSLFSKGRLHIFRSDLSTHEVTPVTEGKRYVLTIGCLIKE